MGLSEPIAAELQREAATTRKMLERVPEDKMAWRPQEKSMTLGRLAGHIAELPSLVASVVIRDEVDFAADNYQPFEASNSAELLEEFDKNIAGAVEALKGQADDEHLLKPWRLK